MQVHGCSHYGDDQAARNTAQFPALHDEVPHRCGARNRLCLLQVCLNVAFPVHSKCDYESLSSLCLDYQKILIKLINY